MSVFIATLSISFIFLLTLYLSPVLFGLLCGLLLLFWYRHHPRTLSAERETPHNVTFRQKSPSTNDYSYSKVNGYTISNNSMHRTPTSLNRSPISINSRRELGHHYDSESASSSPFDIGLFGSPQSQTRTRNFNISNQENLNISSNQPRSEHNRSSRYSSVGHLPTIRLTKMPPCQTKPFPTNGQVTVKIAKVSSPPNRLSTIEKLTSSFGGSPRLQLQENRRTFMNTLHHNSRKRNKPEPVQDQADEAIGNVEKKQREDSYNSPTAIIQSPSLSFNIRKDNKRAAPTEPSPSALKLTKRFKNNSVFSSLSSSRNSSADENSGNFETETSKRKQSDSTELPPKRRELKHPRLVDNDRIKVGLDEKLNSQGTTNNEIKEKPSFQADSINVAPVATKSTSTVKFESKITKRKKILSNILEPSNMPSLLYMPTLQDQLTDQKKEAMRLSRYLSAFRPPDMPEDNKTSENKESIASTTVTSTIATAVSTSSSLSSNNISSTPPLATTISPSENNGSDKKVNDANVSSSTSINIVKPSINVSSAGVSTGFSGILSKTLNSTTASIASTTSSTVNSVLTSPSSSVTTSAVDTASVISPISLSFAAKPIASVSNTTVSTASPLISASGNTSIVTDHKIKLPLSSSATINFPQVPLPLPTASSVNSPISAPDKQLSLSFNTQSINSPSKQSTSTDFSKDSNPTFQFGSSIQSSNDKSSTVVSSSTFPQNNNLTTAGVKPAQSSSGGFQFNPTGLSSVAASSTSSAVTSTTFQSNPTMKFGFNATPTLAGGLQLNTTVTPSTSISQPTPVTSQNNAPSSIFGSNTVTSPTSGFQFNESGSSFSSPFKSPNVSDAITTPSSSTSLFGSPAVTQNNTQPSVFGSVTSSKPAAGFQFSAGSTSSPFKPSTTTDTKNNPPSSSTFLFGAATSSQTSAAASVFGGSSATSAAASTPAFQQNSSGTSFPTAKFTGAAGGFQFNSNADSNSQQKSVSSGGFQFGMPAPPAAGAKTQPVINFGAPGTVNNKVEEKPSTIQFGQPTTNSTPKSTQFQFGASNNNQSAGNTSFQFGSGATSNAPSTAFKFGATQNQPTVSSSPFAFGSTSSVEPAKPASVFQFGGGASSQIPAPANPISDSRATFQFGASPASGFQFGASNANQNGAPMFSPGPSASTSQRRTIQARRRKH